jgi:hypothetical protein
MDEMDETDNMEYPTAIYGGVLPLLSNQYGGHCL